jgi:hypothetical protein
MIALRVEEERAENDVTMRHGWLLPFCSQKLRRIGGVGGWKISKPAKG